MIIHLFNSSIVSGPEMLVLPALKHLNEAVQIIFLSETRLLQESKGPVEYAKSLGHTVHEVAVGGRWDRKAFRKLRELLDALKPEIVHAHDVKASLYLVQAKKIKKNFQPLIVSTHHGASYRTGKIKLYEEIYVRYALPKFDLTLAVCQVDQASMIRRGVPAGKVKIHSNGTDRVRVDAIDRVRVQQEIRAAWKNAMPDLPSSEDAVFLGAVARLSPEKRHDRMLNVLRELSARAQGSKKIILLCFGRGPEETQLKSLAKRLGVQDLVFWMGYSHTISQEMAGFDLLLCLSDGEGIPINLIEAGWSATPVFSTEVGGIPDLIDSPEVGVLVKKSESDSAMAETMSKIIQNESALEKLGLAYQDRVMSQFSEHAWLTRLKTLYQNLRHGTLV